MPVTKASFSRSDMKFLLYYFEWLPRLKINYHKSEVITFGVDKEAVCIIANMLNLDNFLWVTWASRLVKGWVWRPSRVLWRIWSINHERGNLTSGKDLTLNNTSLSSMPIYMMGMFLLYEGIHQQMDTVRSSFFWGSDGSSFIPHGEVGTCLLAKGLFWGGGWWSHQH
jgi:hypothetical protein